jgi:type IV pilus assembly protein PilA
VLQGPALRTTRPEKVPLTAPQCISAFITPVDLKKVGSDADERAVVTLTGARKSARHEDGFTLIELLVVILIIGILAAIAIPSFLSQTVKAYDASAKELARTAETTALTIGTDNGNTFTNTDLTLATLSSYESTIQTASGGNNAFLVSAGPGSSPPTTDFYVVAQAASTGDQFEIERTPTGSIYRFCAAPTTSGGSTYPSGWPITSGTATSNTATSVTSGGCVNGSW